MIRSSLDNTNVAIAKEIDSRYDNIKAVADALPEIEIVVNNLDSIITDADSIDSIIKVANSIDNVNNFSSVYTISDVAPVGHTEGDLWYDTVNDVIRISNGIVWVNAYTPTPEFASIKMLGGTGTQGTISWNPDEETLDVIQGEAVLQVGQELQVHCRNSTATTIGQGIVVMATGTLGASGRIKVAPYIAGVDAKYILGVTTEDIGAGTDGKVTTFGKVRGINTSVWNEGDVLYIGTNGVLVNVEPTEGIINAIAFVITKHAVKGTIMVRFTPASEGNAGQYLGNAKVKGIEYLAKSSVANDIIVIKSSTNALSVDSFTILDGASVTIEDGAVWKII